MRLLSLETHGIGSPFRDSTVRIDFADLPPGVIAVVGDNGSGKSHVVELSGPGALFRELPSYRGPTGKRGESLVDHVHPDTRDAYVDLTFETLGQAFRVRVSCDGKRRKTEAFVWRAGEDTPIAGPLASDVDAALAGIVPSRAMFLAGPFACQGGADGFFRLGPSERKALFVEMLGLGHLEALATGAADREKAALAELDVVRRELGQVAERATRAAEIAEALAALAPQVAASATALEQARAAEAEARVTLDLLRGDLTRLEAERVAATRERERLDGERLRAAARVTALTEQLAAIDVTLADADAIAAQAAELVQVDAAIDAARRQEATTVEALRPLETGLATLRAEVDNLRTTHARLVADRAAADIAMTTVTIADRVAADLPAARAAVTAASVEVDDATNRRPALVVAAEEEGQARITRIRLEARQRELSPPVGLLTRIPGAPECETCPLTAHARQARQTLAQVEAELADVPAPSTAAAEALTTFDAALATQTGAMMRGREWLSLLERLAAVEDATRAQAARGTTLTAEIADLVATGTAKRAAVEAQAAQVADLTTALEVARSTIRTGNVRRDTLTAAVDRLPAIHAARAERAGIEAQLDAAHIALAEIVAAAVPDVDLTMAIEAVSTATQEVTTADATAGSLETLHRAAVDRHTRLDGERAGLGDVEAQAAALRERETALATDASDWAILRKGLGKTGVQALLVDAAGPEVSAIANDLLATCYTPRFQLALTTTQPTADGKGVREVFEPRLLDAEAGRDGTRGSGGETALIDAALRLAVVLVNTRRSGIEMRTLWLDESMAALSAENAPKFVAMVRRVIEQGGFYQALLVTHDPNIWEGCDARLIVEDGTVRVWQPAAQSEAA